MLQCFRKAGHRMNNATRGHVIGDIMPVWLIGLQKAIGRPAPSQFSASSPQDPNSPCHVSGCQAPLSRLMWWPMYDFWVGQLAPGAVTISNPGMRAAPCASRGHPPILHLSTLKAASRAPLSELSGPGLPCWVALSVAWDHSASHQPPSSPASGHACSPAPRAAACWSVAATP